MTPNEIELIKRNTYLNNRVRTLTSAMIWVVEDIKDVESEGPAHAVYEKKSWGKRLQTALFHVERSPNDS